LLGGFLGSMIGISLSFLWIAVTHPDPRVVEDAWASEPGIADAIRARQAAESRGWALAVETADVVGGVRLHVTLRDAEGRALRAERVRVRRERPAEGGLDADLELARAGSDFVGEVPLPRAGRWTVTVSAEREGGLAERRLALLGPG
jgi:nitrogen fixation protein FixH